MQAESSGFTRTFWKALSSYITPLIVAAPFVLTYMRQDQRARSFFYLLVTATTLLITFALQNIFLQPRPYWVNGGIQALDCQS